MPKRTRRTNLNSLVEKYQNLSVVSEIERNLFSTKSNLLPVNKLSINDLYNENNYSLEHYKALEESLKKDGFLAPLIVVKDNGNYEIINGVKRFLLAKKLNFSTVPCVEATLNLERKHTYILQNILEEGDHVYIKTYAFDVLSNKYHYSDKHLAELSSLSLMQVRNIKRLKGLPDFIIDAIKKFKISYSEARALLNLPLEKQKELFNKATEGLLSVRDLEKEKRLYLGNQHKRKVTLHDRKVTIVFSTAEEAKKFYPLIEKEFSD